MALAQLYEFMFEKWSHYGRSSGLTTHMHEVFSQTWHYGLTAFGGPPAHFQIFHKDFVQAKKDPWLDEQTYQELFALCQALPGPASTKFLFTAALIRGGFTSAGLAFVIWTLPGAIGMLCLAFGVQRISEILPDPVYALLSGLNASAVGIVAVAAVQLSEKCIKDQVSRILVIAGACAGICYSALWYFPLLVSTGGVVTVVWDLWLGKRMRRYKQKQKTRRRHTAVDEGDVELEDRRNGPSVTNPEHNEAEASNTRAIQPNINDEIGISVQRRPAVYKGEPENASMHVGARIPPSSTVQQSQQVPDGTEPTNHVAKFGLSTKAGIVLLFLFIVSFVVLMVVRSQIHSENRALPVFANMYLAGTIIFGGGPVVIPLLREYVVSPGWVSPRDFLIGLAIIQAFPGPNFNFAIYLGALALAQAGTNAFQSSLLGALLGYVGIFAPGLLFAIFTQALWRKLRTKPLFIALLRGINATAVGLVFTAFYRLWETGYLSRTSNHGKSLAQEPWWVVITTLTYAGNKWFGVPAIGCILIGSTLGLAWWGATQT